MKKLTTLLCLFISCVVTAQQTRPYSPARKAFAEYQNSLRKRCHKCDCSIIPPFTVITRDLANKRFELFELKRTRTGQKIDDGILYSIKGIEALLDVVTPRKRNKYDGLRVYFAFFPEGSSKCPGDTIIPKDQRGKLTLVFVPTTRKRKQPKYHGDDTTNCMIVDGDSVIHIPMCVAQFGAGNAQTGILALFDTDGKKHRTRKPVYSETHSLWYSRGVLAPNWVRNGLRDVLKCRDMSGASKYIYARFAAFISGYRRQYQLTLVFEPSNGIGKTSGYVSYFDLEDPASTAGSDTGNPCPPPSKCSTVGDAISQ